MEKIKIQVNMDNFPKELHSYLEGTEIYDSSCRSTAKVYYISTGYYLKVDAKRKLEREVFMADWFYKKGLGAKMIQYITTDQDYMLTKAAEGEDCLSDLNHPEKLCELLAETMRTLHSMPIFDVPKSVAFENFLAALENGKGDYCESVLMPRFMISSKEEAWEIMQANKHRLKCDTLIHEIFVCQMLYIRTINFPVLLIWGWQAQAINIVICIGRSGRCSTILKRKNTRTIFWICTVGKILIIVC